MPHLLLVLAFAAVAAIAGTIHRQACHSAVAGAVLDAFEGDRTPLSDARSFGARRHCEKLSRSGWPVASTVRMTRSGRPLIRACRSPRQYTGPQQRRASPNCKPTARGSASRSGLRSGIQTLTVGAG